MKFLIKTLFIVGLCLTTPAYNQENAIVDSFTSIMTILRSPVSFAVLVGELQATKIGALLEKKQGEKKVTLLAPTDTAFNAFGQLGALRGTPLIEDFLKFHILQGAWNRKRLKANRTAKTLADKPLNLRTIGKILYSIETDNGIIHVVDKVALHPQVKKKLNIK
ncbi:fasciclin domain-containing protein [Candidatus Dependentiae bacterium]|nr:fasciclin domain-containing protein [Candidatus Dependentiae bacterium]